MAAVRLTPAQIRCLLVGPWAFGWDTPSQDTIIEPSSNGWIYVEDADTKPGGVGVLIDPGGVVHYSPPERSMTNDPWPVEIMFMNDEEIILRIARP